MSARPDNLDVLPFADVADADPDALPFGEPCAACLAEPGEECRPWCVGQAAAEGECPTCAGAGSLPTSHPRVRDLCPTCYGSGGTL